MKKITAVAIVLFSLLNQQLYAQLNFEQLIRSGPADAQKLVEAYSKPLLSGFGLGMNSGWANTAQTLGPLHFDIRVTGTGSIVPLSKQTFDVTGIGLSSILRPSNAQDIYSPTFSGTSDKKGPMMDLFDANNNKLISFELPPGVIKGIVPTPQVQLTVGFFANTDFNIRFSPKLKLGEHYGSVSMIGFAVKHNIVRDFVDKDVKNTPFDLAILVGFNSLKYGKHLDLKPLEGMVPENEAQVADFTTQEVYANFDNYLIQAVLSKKLSFFTPFVSVGYNISGARLGLRGNYPIINSIRNDQLAYITYNDPFSLERTYLKTMRVDTGFEIRLPILRIFASYGFSGGYGMLNGGIGLGI